MKELLADSPYVPEGFRRWFEAARKTGYAQVERVPLDSVQGWDCGPDAPALTHRSGRFFSVEGLRTSHSRGAVPCWDQPIINQPETGILGILVRWTDGVLHCLVQAKAEPGNINGIQLSPTVQATRSNFTGVHRGKSVPYLAYFQNAPADRVIVDVRQSEQASWFLRKRNRNMIVETHEDIAATEGFRWLPVAEVLGLLRIDDLVGMDLRSVLACLPVADAQHSTRNITRTITRTGVPRGPVTTAQIRSWLTAARSEIEVRTEQVPLAELEGWRRGPTAITHESGRFFDVIGVRVRASGREVREWAQPMIAAHGTGVVAFLTTRFDGELHVLVHQRVEPGFVDVVELGPTVQCTERNYDQLPPAARPLFLDDVLKAPADRILLDVTLSDEGGRLFRTRSRHLLVETDQRPDHPDFRWMTPAQLSALLRHSHYVNMQARSLLACLHALRAPAVPVPTPGQGATRT
ncbi:NDP-hexose 2,3-dehydratase [Streptomyces spiroverticillatus]|uniref:NDP-hexose 2,3-dehydratase n=1 Tax=Streptomyces finlayi TaxID=67296 RepID=A0A919CFF9_9ACTN|nr:NDP-hexose 2,3-dehydratase family protein [Streptomyces finlayi]GHA44165.1 NDP-hexose 2,3-dehydratase [Streptomyces spiroverticillatus]GHD17666.1 NDP-hexose 2,3-dehydratase [Streptomyces finlayi]